jgi:hypothetical protein
MHLTTDAITHIGPQNQGRNRLRSSRHDSAADRKRYELAPWHLNETDGTLLTQEGISGSRTTASNLFDLPV